MQNQILERMRVHNWRNILSCLYDIKPLPCSFVAKSCSGTLRCAPDCASIKSRALSYWAFSIKAAKRKVRRFLVSYFLQVLIGLFSVGLFSTCLFCHLKPQRQKNVGRHTKTMLIYFVWPYWQYLFLIKLLATGLWSSASVSDYSFFFL